MHILTHQKGDFTMSSQIPKDPAILLSFINTQLRDSYPSLEELCASLGIDEDGLTQKLSAIDYIYDHGSNQFQ